ncbi:MAG: hypothetical protein AAFN93_21000 [Bacteroidota bacterium]
MIVKDSNHPTQNANVKAHVVYHQHSLSLNSTQHEVNAQKNRFRTSFVRVFEQFKKFIKQWIDLTMNQFENLEIKQRDQSNFLTRLYYPHLFDT